MPNESGNGHKNKASTRAGKGSASASVSGSIDGRKRGNNSEPSLQGPPSKIAKTTGEKPPHNKQARKDGKKLSSPSKSSKTASNGNAKSAANTTVIEAVVHAPASTATTAEAVGIISDPPASLAVTTQSINQDLNLTNTSQNTTQLSSIIPTASPATYNLFLQALHTVLQGPGTLSARAEDTTGSHGKSNPSSLQTPTNLKTSQALPARAGDTTGPRSSAPCTVSRAPSSPERDSPPDRAGDLMDANTAVISTAATGRKSRNRTRDFTTPRHRESADIGRRAYPPRGLHSFDRKIR